MPGAATRSARWRGRAAPSHRQRRSRPATGGAERERNAGAAARQQAIENYVGEFETMVRQTLNQLGDASGQMRTTSNSLSTVSRQTNTRVQVAEKASSDASMSVDSVAAASEEL